MSERSVTVPTLTTLITKSLSTFPRNKHIFLLIFTFLTLPLSLLHFSLSLSSLPTRRHIIRLETLAHLAHTRFEARQVWQESRGDAISLFRLKLLLFLPSLSLSLLSAVSSIVAAADSYHNTQLTLKKLFSSIKPIWVRPLLTSLCVYVLMFMYSSGFNTLMAATNRSGSGLVVWVVGLGFEVYLMGVMGLALVVSVLESRVGLEAIRIGWELMEGRRLCGWVVSGALMVMTWWVGWELERMVEMDGEDDGNVKRTVRMRGWEVAALVVVYAVVVVFGFVIFSVFYCESRKRLVVRDGEVEDMVNDEEGLGVIL